jgi:hypothetical protein
MTFSEADQQKLSDIAARLPNWSQNTSQAQADVRFLLWCIEQRNAELTEVMKSVQFSDVNFAALRCESQALQAGRSALQKFWSRRFETPMASS